MIHWGSVKKVIFGLNGLDFSIKPIWETMPSSECMHGHPVDGVLGYSFFENYVVEIDYEARKITLANPDTYTYVGNGRVLALDLSKQWPIVRSRIAPIGSAPTEGQFIIDTGYSGAVALNRHFVERLRPSPERMVSVPGWCGLGGELATHVGRLESFQLGEFTFRRPFALFPEAKAGALTWQGFDGVVGSEILQRFRVRHPPQSGWLGE